MGSGFVQVPTDAWDVLTREVHRLNESLRQSQLEKIYTEILDSSDAARYLKVSERYLQSLRDNGELRFFQHSKLIRYRREDLDNWLNAHAVG